MTDNQYSYALGWLVTIPLEIIAASLTLSFWDGAKHINAAAWVSVRNLQAESRVYSSAARSPSFS